jgi:hypothetical protein
VNSYESALAALPDRAVLEALLARTVFAGVDEPKVPAMADYVVAQRDFLVGQPLEAIVAGDVTWGPI